MDGTGHSKQYEVTFTELGNVLERVSGKYAQVPAWCQCRNAFVSILKSASIASKPIIYSFLLH